jgi:hypothetical protein
MEFKEDEIYSIKIANGDEVVGKVKKVSTSSIELHSPLTVVPMREGIQLVPSLFTTELHADVVLNINSVVMVGEARDSIKDSYIEATTGIKPIRSQILTG